jgi:hypothetical protein
VLEMLSEKTMRRLVRSKAPPKVVYNDLENINEYLDKLYSFIKHDQALQLEILRKLNTPIGPNNIERLLMCTSMVLEQEFENLRGFDYEPILDIKLYISLEEYLRDTLYKQQKLDPTKMERKHILHKLIFDSINEKLDHKRIFGLKGLPMSYSIKQASATNLEGKMVLSREQTKLDKSSISKLAVLPQDCEKILQDSRAEIEEWALMKNGLLIENCSNRRQLEHCESRKEKSMVKLLKNYVSFENFIPSNLIRS